MRVCFSYVCVSVSEEYVCMCECFSSECVSVSVVSVRVFHRYVCESVSISYVLNGPSYIFEQPERANLSHALHRWLRLAEMSRSSPLA